ncbi:SusC/RagA family TonB-linked outer membrane protein [Fulvivirga ligni]|uniref:SusC/RagA family TonB-linked outer membrane protein n=1 Tax=Fulvivirga ligni TaxID=2904246 RepID=UPI001F337A48|nr:TonB-dependent receptor [Fulvivirga ligni]UII20651.1 TonB-dependent receptor [Fulvivirga ligni]
MKVKCYLIISFLILSRWALAQSGTVTGTVTDAETSDPLPGVSVLVKGTTQGTVTDINGSFTLQAAPENELIFSFIGYLSQEVVVGNKTNFNIVLAQDVETLEEVVVVGYGTQKKSLTTGAISSVKADELKTVSAGRIDQALQGRTSGVNIVRNSGSPGSGTKIRIRGVSSNGGTDPLFIIDGVRTGAAGMDYLSPSEIESIEVLKDAASAAIYGAEGANGVVIVTTKKGKANSTTVTYSGQYGVQSVRPDLMPMMDAQQYQEYMETAGVSGAPAETDLPPVGNGTNWFDELFQDAPQQNHSLTFSGGTDKSTYFVGGTLFKQEGVAGGDKAKFDRYTFRFNSKHEIKKWLTVGENISYANLNRKGISEDTEFGSIVGSALALDPITPVTYEDNEFLPAHVVNNMDKPLLTDRNGDYYGISNFVKGEYGNPLARIDIANGNTVQNKILGNVFLELSPIEGLKITSRFGIDAAWQKYHNWTPSFWFSSESLNTDANGSDSWNEWYTWQFENFASYDKNIGDHHFTLLAGLSQQKYTANWINGSYAGLFREQDKWSYADYVPQDDDRIGSGYETRTLASFFGRINYEYKDKYLFNATVRRDGSSMLADGKQWGTFPSVSLGWVFSNENFFPTGLSSIVNYAKLRASWGQNGSLSNLSPGQWQNSISTNINGIIQYPVPGPDGDVYIIGAAPTNLQNPFLTWETSEQLDFGADFRFLDGKLNFTFDYYKKTTKDLITPGSPPGFVGNGLPFFNAGTVLNRGLEFDLGYGNTAGDFSYDVNVMFSTLKNEVTYLDPNYPVLAGVNVGTGWSQVTQFTEGRPVWFYSGFETDGIFQNQEQVDAYLAEIPDSYTPEPGYPVIIDQNDDGVINSDDRVYLGDAVPDYTLSTTIKLKYKGFDFLAFVTGQFGREVVMGFNRTDRPTTNKPAFFYEDRWTGEGSTNDWFAANTDDSFIYSSDLMVFDGSFARIQQLQLGYTLPQSVLKNAGIKNLRMYVSLDNYFTFTKYPGLDPEAGSNDVRSIGIDRGVYPVPRVILGGLSFSF